MKYINWLFRSKKCSSCSKDIWSLLGAKYWTTEGNNYCEECARANFKFCECCNKIVNKLRTVEDKKICNDCFIDKTEKCPECGVRKFSTNFIMYAYDNVCNSCYRLLHRNFHNINIGQRKAVSKTFIKNPNKGYVGVEIECLNSYRDANSFILKELKEFRFSQGKDASLNYGGVEFRSVPMNGDLLFNSIEEFGKALNKKRYEVDSTCGLHIHLEVKQDIEHLKKLYLFYLRFEDMFFNMLPKSRRSKHYCARFKEYYKDTPEEIMEVETLNRFKEMLYETKYYSREIRSHENDKRYCWANLHSMFYRGTLEIRSHSGTINSSKIINWIMIHQRVLEFLDEKSLEDIGKIKVTKKSFLEIFNKPVQNYIKRRWATFIKFEEEDLKARAPVYINIMAARENIKNV